MKASRRAALRLSAARRPRVSRSGVALAAGGRPRPRPFFPVARWSDAAGGRAARGPGRSTSCTSARSRPKGPSRRSSPAGRSCASWASRPWKSCPSAQFPGDRNWGYDGVHPYAVQNSYGGPQGLQRLVDAAHRGRPGGDPRRGLQPSRPGGQLPRPLRPLFHRPLSHALGRRR